MGYEINVWIVFIPKSHVWYEVQMACLWLLCVFWESELMPFGGCLRDFDILSVISSKSPTPQLGLDQSWYRARSSEYCWYTYIDEMLDIYLLSIWGDEKKSNDSLEVVREQACCLSWPWIYRSDLTISLHYSHLYNLWVYEADIVDLFLFCIFFTFILHD